MSSRPYSRTASRTHSSTSFPTPTLVLTKAPFPTPCRRVITSCVATPCSSSGPSSRESGIKSAQMTRLVPHEAKSRAMARPSPEDDPVTTATLPSRVVEEKAMVVLRIWWKYENGGLYKRASWLRSKLYVTFFTQ